MVAREDILTLTSARFPHTADSPAEVVALEKGGSDRNFHRIRNGENSMIFVKYSDRKEENRHYVDIARFLAGVGVPVPGVFEHDPQEGLIWMQDMGEDDLWSHRNEPWSVRRPLYESTLDAVLAMHTSATDAVSGVDLHLERVFDADLYRWEQGYFFDNCLGTHFGIDGAELETLRSLPALNDAAEHLASLPRVLVHRDFQSQNVMIQHDRAWLIDFQGMRFGLPQYDLASLLHDPYVTLLEAEKAELLTYYKSRLAATGTAIPPDFDTVFDWCSVQRLMQALGAYGFLGHHKGRADFLVHIPAARATLCRVASRLDGLQQLVDKLNSLP
jgi:N-acetylmuramate 1-kinase